LKAWNKAKQYIDVPIEEFDEKDLPDSFDWRDIDGYDFTSLLRD